MMTEQALAWLAATWALVMVGLLQPWAAACVGAFVGGYVIGESKNRTAIAELSRGLVSGLVAFLAVWAIQQLLRGGL